MSWPKKHKGQFQKGDPRVKEWGAKGGRMGNPASKGFAGMSPQERREAGRRGGLKTNELGHNVLMNEKRKKSEAKNSSD